MNKQEHGGTGHNIGRDNIEYHFHNGSQAVARILTEKRASVPVEFVGRDKELKDVHQRITKQQPLVLVNGEGGIGKTTLAAQYWQQYASNYQHVAWLFCEQGIVDALRQNLVHPLGLSQDMRNYPDPVQQNEIIKTAMANLKKDCLLVLDNVSTAEHITEFQTYFGGLDWHVLITSRCQKLLDNEYYIAHLPFEEGMLLFKKYYNEQNDTFESFLNRFLLAVGGNTLCIEIFSKNLREAAALGENIQSFLSHLEQKGLYLGENSFEVHTAYAQKRTATTDEFLDILYDFSKLSIDETDQLIQLALLPAENHDLNLLLELFMPASKPKFKRALDNLAKKGWLFSDSSAYRLSPVVQKLMLHKYADSVWPRAEHLIAVLVKKLEIDEGYLKYVNEIQAKPFTTIGFDLLQKIKEKNALTFELYDRLCRYYQLTGDLQQALFCADQLLQTVVPAEIYYKEPLAYNRLGMVYMAMDELQTSLDCFVKSADLYEELEKLHPDNEGIKDDIVASYSFIIDIQNRLGHDSMPSCEKCYRIANELYQSNKEDAAFIYGFAVVCIKLGETCKRQGRAGEAMDHFNKCISLCMEACKADPGNVAYKNSLAVSYSALGGMYVNEVEKLTQSPMWEYLPDLKLQARKLYNAALEVYKVAESIHIELYEANPGNLGFKNSLSLAKLHIGETLRLFNNYEEALIYFEERHKVIEELYNAYPQIISYKDELAIAKSRIGETYVGLENFPSAMLYLEEAHLLMKELYEKYPKTTQFKNGMAVSYYKIAILYYHYKGKSAKVHSYLLAAKEIWEQMHADSPASIDYITNLQMVNNSLVAYKRRKSK